MNPLRRYSLLLMIAIGSILIGQGVFLWAETRSGGVIRNWVTPASVIPSHQYMWTWGVDGVAKDESDLPDLWHFHIVFSANDTAEVLLTWNLNQSILFQRNSLRIDETFDVALPRTNGSWRWDWLIKNPHSSALRVDNFTITHYSVRYPERRDGFVAVGTGFFIIFGATAALVYVRRRDSRQRELCLSRPPNTSLEPFLCGPCSNLHTHLQRP